MEENVNVTFDALGEIASRKLVSKNQKSWKYIYEVCGKTPGNLKKTAIEDGACKYTYERMFHEWEHYAAVFSALGIGQRENSRVGILGSVSAEVIFSVYGLNMVGADVSIIPSYSALMPGKVLRTIEDENITDFIITDDFAQVNLICDLLLQSKKLGLKNVIILHIPVTGVTVSPMLTAAQEAKYQYLKGQFRPICMDELLKIYEYYPINYAEDSGSDFSLILHTSGTTGGTGKPVPLSDCAVNSAVAAFYDMSWLELPWDNLVTAVSVDLSNAYGFIDQVHLPFAMGAKVVVAPGGILNPFFYKAIPKHKITFLFTISAMFLRWLKLTDKQQFDFSSLKFVALGGAAVSVSEKKSFLEFMQRNKAGDVTILNGYGVSELGGACCLSTKDIEDGAIGYPIPGVNVRLYDDERKCFLAPGTSGEGVLYLNSPAIATLSLDGKDVVKAEFIDDVPYICTNDLVHVDTDGKINFLGRAGRYFINEDGKNFDAGRVENEFAGMPDIESCCIVPVYIKTTHDNIPMLCVKMNTEMECSKDAFLRILKQIYIDEKKLGADNIPVRVKIVYEMPRNGNGKIDLYKLGSEEVGGFVYTVEVKKKKGLVHNFKLVPYEDGPADMIKEVFDGLSAELKESLPHNNMIKFKEEQKMGNTNNFFEGFNAMNQMGKQMMNNMMGGMAQMGQMNQNQNQMQGFCNPSFSCMPDMTKVMADMQQMHHKAADMMPNIPQINQMVNTMIQMNLMALNMMQKTIDQNTQMMNQYMELIVELNKKAMRDVDNKCCCECSEEDDKEAVNAEEEEAVSEAAEVEEAAEPKKTTRAKSTGTKKTAAKKTAVKKTSEE